MRKAAMLVEKTLLRKRTDLARRETGLPSGCRCELAQISLSTLRNVLCVFKCACVCACACTCAWIYAYTYIYA